MIELEKLSDDVKEHLIRIAENVPLDKWEDVDGYYFVQYEIKYLDKLKLNISSNFYHNNPNGDRWKYELRCYKDFRSCLIDESKRIENIFKKITKFKDDELTEKNRKKSNNFIEEIEEIVRKDIVPIWVS